jgi:hypothetical protein
MAEKQPVLEKTRENSERFLRGRDFRKAGLFPLRGV